MTLRIKDSRQREGRRMDINMTSMVDIVFLLIIFFMLVSSYISAENIEVDLPQPDNSVAASAELPERVVLNCQNSSAEASKVRYWVGPVLVEDVAQLELRLATIGRENPATEVVLRADRQVPYGRIRDAMEAIARSGLKTMNIAAGMEDGAR